mmetsp:Transcript_67423/g.185936  ORF Transcript_67423/g.185936 Transcript_67423/m.185936 type:complete len:450 (+) Transcript_67423:1427-2776(+)
MANLSHPFMFIKNFTLGVLQRIESRAMYHLPLADVDKLLTGDEVPFFQDAVHYPDETGPFWRDANVLCGFEQPVPSTHIVTGWYDFFLEEALRDYQRALDSQTKEPVLKLSKERSANTSSASSSRPAMRMTIGGYDHWALVQPLQQKLMFNCMLPTLDENLKGIKPTDREYATNDNVNDSSDPSAPVQLYVMGATGSSYTWLGMESWPPPSSATTTTLLHVTAGKMLTWEPCASSHSSSPRPSVGDNCYEYAYWPARPTPSRGGPSFNLFNAGVWDQRPLEGRDDILVLTSGPLTEKVTVIGEIKFDCHVWSSANSADFVARLCDVAPSGYSTNLCEGLTRVNGFPGWTPTDEPATGSTTESATKEMAKVGQVRGVTINVGPIAAEFGVGHRIRLHVCSAAHPRWFRNLGDDQAPLAPRLAPPPQTCHTQRVYFGSEFPSSLKLPVLAA